MGIYKTLIGASAAIVLGLIGLLEWWKLFLQLLEGAIPLTLLLGGGLALYLGFDELKDSWKKEETLFDASAASDDVEIYMTEIGERTMDIEALKSEDFSFNFISKIDPKRALEEELKKLQEGQLFSNIPKKMQVGITERIEVLISTHDFETYEGMLKGIGIPQIDQITIGPFMSVKLTGDPSDFDITELSKEAQFVADDQPTRWEWDVLPLKSGQRTLRLHVTIRIKISSSDEYRDLPVFYKEVEVDTNLPYTVNQFFIKNWKALFNKV